jgi:uncharacterized protein YbjT (DUF2867 family)
MPGDAGATTFITGASGFLGAALVRVLTGRGHRVFALAHSVEAAQRLRHAGAVPVMGNLLEPGQWQDEAAAGATRRLVSRFRYPTLDQGLRQVLGALDA